MAASHSAQSAVRSVPPAPGCCFAGANASAVGGHFWTPATAPDPWLGMPAMWASDANGNAVGSFTVEGPYYTGNGYGYAGNLGHAVVVHNPNGTRVGCGVLTATVTQATTVMYASAAATFSSSTCNTTFNTTEDTTYISDGDGASTGHSLTVAQARNRPNVSFAGSTGMFYTVVLAELLVDVSDVPGHYYGQGGNYLSWMVTNVPGQNGSDALHSQG